MSMRTFLEEVFFVKKYLALALSLLMVCAMALATPASADDVVELIWLMGNPGTVPADQAKVEEALNAILEPAIGVRINVLYMSNDEVQLAMNAGDPYDIAFTCSWWNNYANQANKGMFFDITDKVKTLTPDLYAAIPELVWEGAKVDGAIYAVPVYKDTAASLYWQFKKEVVVDELGFDIEQFNTFDSIEPVLEAFKAAHPDQYPVNVSKGGIRVLWNDFEILNNGMLIGLEYAAKDTNVVSVFDSPAFLDRLATVHSWFEKGYINPDAPTLDVYPSDFVVLNQQGYPGAESEWSNTFGHEIVATKYHGPVLSTTSIRGAMNAINAASPNVDKALEFLQIINTDTRVRDILAYGVEGVNFEYINDGAQVNKLDDGYKPWIWAQASQYALTPATPTTTEMVEALKSENDKAAAEANAATIGFSFNILPVETEAAACTTVMEKYRAGLVTGSIDPATEVPKMLEELEKAGYRDIIAECQAQLDEFVGK